MSHCRFHHVRDGVNTVVVPSAAVPPRQGHSVPIATSTAPALSIPIRLEERIYNPEATSFLVCGSQCIGHDQMPLIGPPTETRVGEL